MPGRGEGQMRDGRTSRHAGALRVLLSIAVCLSAVIALGTGASAEEDLRVEHVVDGRFPPGAPVPVLVTVESDALFQGEIVVISGGAEIREPVEVAAGSAKQLVLIAPTTPYEGQTITVRLEKGEEIVATGLLNSGRGSAHTIGVLGSLASSELPTRASVGFDLPEAELLPIDADVLPNGPAVLGPLGSLVIAPRDFVDLSAAERDVVVGWVTFGGELYIDGSPDAAPATLPREWVPTTGDRVAAGWGSVTFTHGAAAAGLWDGLVLPAPGGSLEEFGFFGGFFPMEFTLAEDAGLDVPSLGVLLWILVSYVVVVGPVLFFLLRVTNRKPLMWVAVPGLALGVTFALWLVGRDDRQSVTAAHATVLESTPGGTWATSTVMVSSASGGSAGVRLPDGWHVGSQMNSWNGQRANIQVAGGQALVDLPPGGNGTLIATGPTDGEAALVLTAEADGSGGATGTITNTSDRHLSDIVVLSHTEVEDIGDLAPGESESWKITNVVGTSGVSEAIFRVWGDAIPAGFNPFGPGNRSQTDELSAVNPGAFLAVHQARTSWGSTSGAVTAVGWTRDGSAPVSTNEGTRITSGRTAFVTHAAVVPGSGVEPTARVAVVSSDRAGGGIGFGPGGTLRLVMDGVDDDDPLALTFRRGTLVELDLWTPDGWKRVAVDDARSPLLLPAEARVGGVVFARVSYDENRFWNGPEPSLLHLDLTAPDDPPESVVVWQEDIDAAIEAAAAAAAAVGDQADG